MGLIDYEFMDFRFFSQFVDAPGANACSRQLIPALLESKAQHNHTFELMSLYAPRLEVNVGCKWKWYRKTLLLPVLIRRGAPASPAWGGRLRLNGNRHCRAIYSDAACSPAETVARYGDGGYDLLCLTEHCDTFTRGGFPDFDALDSPDLCVLPGVGAQTEVRSPVSVMSPALPEDTS